MKTLRKAIRVSVIVFLVVTLLAAPMMLIGAQISVTVGNQNFTFQFGSDHPEATAPLRLACCGSGNGTGPG